MTFDERMDRIAQTLESIAEMHRSNDARFNERFRENEKRLAQLMETHNRLGRIIEIHERRLEER